MEYERKPNTASIFRDEEKSNENGPDYTGMGLIEGKTLRLAGWINEAKSGKKYLSLKFSEPREKEEALTKSTKADSDLNEDVPF